MKAVASLLKDSPVINDFFRSNLIKPRLSVKSITQDYCLRVPFSSGSKKIGTFFDGIMQEYVEIVNLKCKRMRTAQQRFITKFSNLNEINGYMLKNINKRRFNPKETEELINLFNVVTKNTKLFTAKKFCLIQPHFGMGYPDFIIDDNLIEIKTTNEIKFERDYFNELMGYYLTSKYKYENIPDRLKRFLEKYYPYIFQHRHNVEDRKFMNKIKINFIGVYYSRHGYFLKLPIKDILKDDMVPENFINKINSLINKHLDDLNDKPPHNPKKLSGLGSLYHDPDLLPNEFQSLFKVVWF